MSKIWTWMKNSAGDVFFYACMSCLVFYFVTNTNKPPAALKEYKDGIQNHLVFNIKGQCYFVRPNDDVTVYLISVPDCDKK